MFQFFASNDSSYFLVAAQTKVWVFGGYDPESKEDCCDMWELCCRAGRWGTTKVFSAPKNKGGAASGTTNIVTALSAFTGPKFGDLVVLDEAKKGRALSGALTPWVVLDHADDVPLEMFAPRRAEVENAPPTLEVAPAPRRHESRPSADMWCAAGAA